MVKPITPKQAKQGKEASIPDAVIRIVNELIKEKMEGNSACVYQDAIVTRVCDALGVSRQEVFDKHWLDFEDIFRRAGWTVTYDKPGYNESYEAHFIFKARPTRSREPDYSGYYKD